jgi:outer membrane receptor for ferric coprogen and ferric-rhodotorulic acid
LGEDKKLVLYGVVEADLTDRTLLRTGASYQDNDPTASTWGGLAPWFSDGTRTDWDRSKTVAADWTFWATTSQNYFVNLNHEFENGWQAKLNYNNNKNTNDLSLVYLYGAPDATTGLGLGVFPYKSDGTSKQNSFDFQLKGDFSLFGREHEFVVGALHSKQEFEFGVYSALDATPVGDFNAWDGSYQQPTWSDDRTTGEDYETTQTGFYGASRLNVSDDLKLVVGGRLAEWKQEGMSYGADIDYGDSGVFIPYAGALYDLTENHTVYASYTEIFQPQNSIDRNGDYLDPLTGKSYEAGVKSTFFDDALHTTASVFLIQQDNLAQVDTGYLVPGTIFEASRAAKGTESKGFEFEVVGELQEGWNLSLGYTQYTAEDAEGNDVNTNHPRKLFKLFTTYQLQDSLEGLTIGGGLNWESSNYTNATNPATGTPERLEQDAYALVSIMARYDISEQLSLQLNVDNLLDKTYYSQIGFFTQLAYGAPRNFNLRARYSF